MRILFCTLIFCFCFTSTAAVAQYGMGHGTIYTPPNSNYSYFYYQQPQQQRQPLNYAEILGQASRNLQQPTYNNYQIVVSPPPVQRNPTTHRNLAEAAREVRSWVQNRDYDASEFDVFNQSDSDKKASSNLDEDRRLLVKQKLELERQKAELKKQKQLLDEEKRRLYNNAPTNSRTKDTTEERDSKKDQRSTSRSSRGFKRNW